MPRPRPTRRCSTGSASTSPPERAGHLTRRARRRSGARSSQATHLPGPAPPAPDRQRERADTWHADAMLDHVGIQCADLAASGAFYDAVLAPLGASRLMDFGVAIGYGVPPKPD